MVKTGLTLPNFEKVRPDAGAASGWKLDMVKLDFAR
jgi:hypothetical protein